MLALYRERLLDTRTRRSNERRRQPHDPWPDREIPAKALAHPGWQTKVQARLARAKQTTQVQIARDTIRRVREPSRAANDLYEQTAALVKQVAPRLSAEPGIGVPLAAKFIGETAGVDRFSTHAASPTAPRSPPPADAQTATASTPAATGGSTAPSTRSPSSASATTPAPPSTSPNNAPTARPNAKRSATSNVTSTAAPTNPNTTPTASQPQPA